MTDTNPGPPPLRRAKPAGHYKVRVLGAVLCVLVVIVVIARYKEWSFGQPPPSAASTALPDKADRPSMRKPVVAGRQVTRVAIAMLLSAYRGDEVRADAAFRGKLIETSGWASNIKKDMHGGVFITLGTGRPFEIPEVQCGVVNDQAGRAVHLSKGTKVTVRGRVDGLTLYVLLRECSIVE